MSTVTSTVCTARRTVLFVKLGPTPPPSIGFPLRSSHHQLQQNNFQPCDGRNGLPCNDEVSDAQVGNHTISNLVITRWTSAAEIPNFQTFYNIPELSTANKPFCTVLEQQTVQADSHLQ